MRVRNTVFVIAALCALAGCSGGAEDLSAKEDASFKQSLAAGKEKLDPETLPPDVRERVKGFMSANKAPVKK